MTIRPRTTDILTKLQTSLHDDSKAAAGGNNQLSRAEQKQAPEHVQQAAELVRAERGAGARISVADVDAKLMHQAKMLIGLVNQPAGSGAPFLSRAEVDRIVDIHPVVGAQVKKAYEILLQRGVDVDLIAKTRAGGDETEPGYMFKQFATVEEAEQFRGPADTTVNWLVATGETGGVKSYVAGRNDMWIETFDVSRLDGSVTVTGEH